MIAHRLSTYLPAGTNYPKIPDNNESHVITGTVMQFDRILVLDNSGNGGEVVE